jgi:serine/threonine-protein kinase
MLPYLAPEAFSGRTRLTAAVDIYALGVVLYELIAGRTPFAMRSEQRGFRRGG